MTFDSDEKSVHDGEPIELFHFATPNTDYFLTSHEFDVDFGGDTYVASPGMEFSNVNIEPVGNVPEVTITMTRSQQLIQDFAFDIPPARDLQVTVRRLHTPTGASLIWWEGAVTSILIRGDQAQVTSPSTMGTQLATGLPSAYFQSQCNHALYDTNCAVLRTSFDHATTVSSVVGTVITVASNGGLTLPSGEIVRDSDGERRMIVSVDTTGLILTINHPFRSIASPNPVTLFAGCPHTVEACFSIFNNVENFGGHPYIPNSNIFKVGFRGL